MALLQAVEAQKLSSLDMPVAPILDLALRAIGIGKMTSLWGTQAASITARHLATMTSGIPDYDTAEPHGHSDPLRASVYASPAKELTPFSLLKLGWVATGKLNFSPGKQKAYSSTNFLLLGLLLAQLTGSLSWDTYQQASILDALPASRRQLYDIRFAVHGTPRSSGAVDGFDRTSYNGQNASQMPGRGVANIAGVFGGWTAADLVAHAADVARFAYDLYGAQPPQLLTPDSRQLMIPKVKFYGFATFNLTGVVGNYSGAEAMKAWGHLGATYGYDSIVAYFPHKDLSIAVGTDIETDSQSTPRDALCVAYNAILAALEHTIEPNCTYVSTSYYKGHCQCLPPTRTTTPKEAGHVSAPAAHTMPPPGPPIPPPDPLCPRARPRNQTFFFFHPPSCKSPSGLPLKWANHDYGDALGEALFYCTDGYSVVHYNDTHMSKMLVEVDPTFGGYQSCTDTEPGQCDPYAKVPPKSISIGDGFHVGRRRAVYYGECGGYPSADTAQCSENAQTGNWFSFPERGECATGTAVGTGGCTWRVVQLLKTVEASCLESLGINASCADAQPVAGGGCSYTGTAKVVAKAFEEEAKGGCANVPI